VLELLLPAYKAPAIDGLGQHGVVSPFLRGFSVLLPGFYVGFPMRSAAESRYDGDDMKRLLTSLAAALFFAIAIAPAAAARPAALRPVLAMRRYVSPDGTFSVAVPRGWRMQGQATLLGPLVRVMSPDESVAVGFWPLVPMDFLNRNYIAAAQHTVQCSQHPPLFGTVFSACVAPLVDTQLWYGSQQHTAADVAQDLLVIFRLGNARIDALSPQEAVVSFEGYFNGRERAVYADLRVLSFPNPMLGQGRISTFAFLTGCQTGPGQITAARPTCAAIMESFRPTARWMQPAIGYALQRYAQEQQQLLGIGSGMAAGYSRESAIIQNWGSNMQQMQYQQFANEQAASYRSGEGWINALGHTEDVWNPNNPSDVMQIPDPDTRQVCRLPDGDFVGYNSARPSGCTGAPYEQGLQPP
jgi:hypothetical protein